MSPFLGTRGAGSSKAFDPGAGRPNQVTGLSATNVGSGRAFNNGRIDLSWTAPANNGAPITGYLIERSTNSGSTWSTLVANTGNTNVSYSDTGLTSAQRYDYRVSAINAVGTGTASTAANATATTVPQAPTIGTATEGNAQATITFTANATGGSSITTFTSTSSPAAGSGSSATSPITHTGLSNGTAYTFTVTATNANGTSAASAASNSVTPAIPTFLLAFGASFSNSSGLYKSTDNGNSWSLVTTLSAGQSSGYGVENFRSMATNGTGIIVGGGRYSATPNQQWLYSSTNSGTTWTAYNPSNTNTGDAFPYATSNAAVGNGLYFVPGGRATNFPSRSFYSTNATTWNFANITTTNNRGINGTVFNPFNNTFYVGLEGATFHSSTNLSSWTTLASYGLNGYTPATLGNSAASVWIRQTNSGIPSLAYFNGSGWTEYQPAAANMSAVHIEAGSGVYVATYSGSDANKLATSPDGQNWTMRANPFTSTNPQTIFYAKDRFYISGTSNTLASSTTGTGSWTILPNWNFPGGGSTLSSIISTT